MQSNEIHVGIDIGSRVHRAAIEGPDGGILDEFDIQHSESGFVDFFKRVAAQERRFGVPVRVAMEGFNGHARPLDALILAHHYPLLNVNNLKLARFKEIFPAPAKSDPIDARKILELFRLQATLPMAKEVLQPVGIPPVENQQLKRLTRRRRQMVQEKTRVVNRLHSDLQAVSPGLVTITGAVDNRWFLHFLTCRPVLSRLARLQRRSIARIRGVGAAYLEVILDWQRQATFASDVDLVGGMIIEDALRILELMDLISALDTRIEVIASTSEIAKRLRSIPGFGATSCAELAGEIGMMSRFTSEGSLALYVGMAVLDNRSGNYNGCRTARQVNRRTKAAMMTAVARHVNCIDSSRRYYDKKRAEGKAHNQAIRSMGRHMVRVIWSMLKYERDYETRDVDNNSA